MGYVQRSYAPQGYGRMATGGMGGTVMEVDTLADSGAGSLRTALTSPERRIIQFAPDMHGLITLQTQIAVTNPNFTLTGRHAAPPGIAITKITTGSGNGPVSVQTNNFIIEHMRFRAGASNRDGGTSSRDSLDCYLAGRGRIKNCSMTWGVDSNFDISTSHTISVERCLIAQSLNYSNHTKGAHGTGGIASVCDGVTYRDNVFAFNSFRNPLVMWLLEPLECINNLVYDWELEAFAMEISTSRANVIGNMFIAGADTDTVRFPIVVEAGTEVLYVRDNLDTHKRTSVAQPEWDCVGQSASYSTAAPIARQQLTPWPGSGAVSIRRATELEAYLLPIVGATLPVRDAIDASIVAQIAGRTGVIVNAVEPNEVTDGFVGSEADPDVVPLDTPNVAQIVANPWATWN